MKKILKAENLKNFIESNSPAPLNGDEYGYVFGNENIAIENVGFVWRLSIEILNEMINDNINIVISHEAVFQKEIKSKWSDDLTSFAIEYNNKLKELITRNNMVVYRYHSNFDAWKNIGVADSFAELLNLNNLIDKGKFSRVYSINEIKSYDYFNSLKNIFKADIRFFGDKNKNINRVGIMIGGFGANQHLMPFELDEMNADIIIMGDMTEKVLINSLSLDIPVIETLHSETEEFSLKKIMAFLAHKFNTLQFKFYNSGAYIYE